jgi:tetratricopeptide (TPR) repeat protein
MEQFIHISKVSLIVVFFLTISIDAKSQDYKEIHKVYKNIHIGDSLYNIEEYKKSLKFFSKATGSMYSKMIAFAYISNCYWYLGDSTKYLKYREKYLKLQGNEEVEQNINEELRAEFLRRKEKDQMYRKPGHISDSLSQIQKEIDIDNQRFLDSVFRVYGVFPGFSLIGKDGARAAYLIAQHADNDVQFQEKWLRIIKKAFFKNEIRKSDFAYLTDRVMINKYGFQLFGSQVVDVDGQFQPKPLYDERIISILRKYFYMNPIEEYLKFMNDRYHKNEDK